MYTVSFFSKCTTQIHKCKAKEKTIQWRAAKCRHGKKEKERDKFLPVSPHSHLVSFCNLHNFNFSNSVEDFRNKNRLLIVYEVCCHLLVASHTQIYPSPPSLHFRQNFYQVPNSLCKVFKFQGLRY